MQKYAKKLIFLCYFIFKLTPNAFIMPFCYKIACFLLCKFLNSGWKGKGEFASFTNFTLNKNIAFV